jgi:hypothetical protein
MATTGVIPVVAEFAYSTIVCVVAVADIGIALDTFNVKNL